MKTLQVLIGLTFCSLRFKHCVCFSYIVLSSLLEEEERKTFILFVISSAH